jgi:hypothetical protein
MAQSDTSIPRFVRVSQLTPPRVFICDVHGNRDIVMQFNPPAGNTIPDVNRLRCVDCLEEVIPNRIRSVT